MQKKESAPAKEVYTKDDLSSIIDGVLSNMETPTKNHMGGAVDFLDPDMWTTINTASQGLAKCDLIPKAFRGNHYNCIAALTRAKALEVDVFWLMSETSVINGELHFSGKAVVALANRSGIFENGIHFDESGSIEDPKTFQCRAYGTIKSTGKEVECIVTYQQAVDFGWVKTTPINEWKNGQKTKVGEKPGFWQLMPRQMMKYRSGSWLSNGECPEVTAGLKISEFADVKKETETIEPAPFFAPDEDKKAIADSPSSKTANTVSDQKTPVPQEKEVRKTVSSKKIEDPKVSKTATAKPSVKKNGESRSGGVGGNNKKPEIEIVSQAGVTETSESLIDDLPLEVANTMGNIIKFLHSKKIKSEDFELFIAQTMPNYLSVGESLTDLTPQKLISVWNDLASMVQGFKAWESDNAR